VEKIAFTFPGQGRIAKDSGAPWADDPAGWPFVRASEILGWDVIEVLESGDAALSDTRKAQPAIYVHSAACHILAREEGLRPDLVAGHSLGEYAALFAAGGVSFEQGLELVVRRAELAHQAGGAGVMRVVLGLPDKTVGQLCRNVRRQVGKVFLANSNAPGQVVISGESAAVEETARRALAAGAKRVLTLPIGGGFHTPLMHAAKRPFKEALDRIDLTRLEVPLVSNAKARWSAAAARPVGSWPPAHQPGPLDQLRRATPRARHHQLRRARPWQGPRRPDPPHRPPRRGRHRRHPDEVRALAESARA
jgi:[acyl-carrier-protein] S-malonyltransferase